METLAAAAGKTARKSTCFQESPQVEEDSSFEEVALSIILFKAREFFPETGIKRKKNSKLRISNSKIFSGKNAANQLTAYSLESKVFIGFAPKV
jgi:hypothetical protein